MLAEALHEEPLSFLLDAPPAETHGADAARVLQVAQVFGTAVIDVRWVPVGGVVRLGHEVIAPAELLGRVLFTHDGDGWIALVDPLWGGFVDAGGVRTPLTGGRHTLRPGERLVITMGLLAWVAEPVSPASRIAHERVDAGLRAILALCGLATAGLATALEATPPPAPRPREAPTERMVELLLERRHDEPAPNEPPTRPTFHEQRLDRQVARETGVLGVVREDAGVLGANGLQGDLQNGIGALIGNKSTSVRFGGLGARGRGLGAGGRGLGGGGHFSAERVRVVHGAPMTGDQYDRIAETGFSTVADAPLSTFSIDVDTASYTNVRRYVAEGTRPPKDAVRIEELLNYFPYDDAPPRDGRPFAARAEVSDAPWAEGHRLVRVAVKAREITTSTTPPRNLVFLVDVSGSMSGPDRLPLVQRGLRMLADQLGPRDHVAMVVYAGAAGVVLEPTPGDQTSRILQAIDGLSAGGSTAGAAGIRAAYDLARRHFERGAVNRVVLATDGDFNVGVSSEGELERLIEQERESGVFLTVLGVGRGNLQDAKMERLADKGNGNYAYVDSFDELRRVLGEQVSATLVTVAKDVKIQVEMNPAQVSAWRLLGYEDRVLAARDFDDDRKDAGEIGAGHTVTALYEIVPAGTTVAAEVAPLRYQADRAPTAAAGSGELLTVKLRYKTPDGDASRLASFPVRDTGASFADASADLRFSAAVAGFGMLLRDSAHKGTVDWAWVEDTARGALGSDRGGYRSAFVSLVGEARRL